MADVNLGELEGEWTRALNAYLTALVNARIVQQTGKDPTAQDEPDPRNQGEKTGGRNDPFRQ
jgi:hypothetical protein